MSCLILGLEVHYAPHFFAISPDLDIMNGNDKIAKKIAKNETIFLEFALLKVDYELSYFP